MAKKNIATIAPISVIAKTGKNNISTVAPKNPVVMSMVNPSTDSLMERVESRYGLVVLAARRARQLLEGDDIRAASQSTKDVTNALEEIAEGKIAYDISREDQDEDFPPISEDEETNDLAESADADVGETVDGDAAAETEPELEQVTEEPVTVEEKKPKKRGRKPKIQPPVETNVAGTTEPNESVLPQDETIAVADVTEPEKTEDVSAETNVTAEPVVEEPEKPAPKKRGRKPKNQTSEEITPAVSAEPAKDESAESEEQTPEEPKSTKAKKTKKDKETKENNEAKEVVEGTKEDKENKNKDKTKDKEKETKDKKNKQEKTAEPVVEEPEKPAPKKRGRKPKNQTEAK